MHIFRRSILLAIASQVMLAGCAATGPQFQQLEAAPSGKAVVYIYRKQLAPRSMDLSPGFVINGKDAGSLPLDGYLRIVQDPGPTDLRMEKRYFWPTGAPLGSVQLNLAPGETRFVEFSVDGARTERLGNTLTTYIAASLREVDRASAMQLLPRLRLQN